MIFRRRYVNFAGIINAPDVISEMWKIWVLCRRFHFISLSCSPWWLIYWASARGFSGLHTWLTASIPAVICINNSEGAELRVKIWEHLRLPWRPVSEVSLITSQNTHVNVIKTKTTRGVVSRLKFLLFRDILEFIISLRVRLSTSPHHFLFAPVSPQSTFVDEAKFRFSPGRLLPQWSHCPGSNSFSCFLNRSVLWRPFKCSSLS